MNGAFDRIKVRQAFHRHAGDYDHNAVVQKRIVARLDQLVATYQDKIPASILDIGCGTGAMLSAMDARYKCDGVFGIDLAFNMARLSDQRSGGRSKIINGDAEHLPFRDQIFDLIVSASTFQWLDELDVSFKECRRVLNKDGMMCMAFFGGRTLWELHECYRDAVVRRYGNLNGRVSRLHQFKGITEVQQALKCFSKEPLMIKIEEEVVYHTSVAELLRSIKSIGASTTARSETTGGLGWRGILNDLAENYHLKFEQEGLVPATYEVIYVVVKC